MEIAICTYNPRRDYLLRTLESLAAQTMTGSRVLLVDNNSSPAVTDWLDGPEGLDLRIVREEEQGLTQSRLRAIRETEGEILLFVDDDNELGPDYLRDLQRLFEEHCQLGVIGAGKILPEFEREPAEAHRKYLPALALRDQEGDHWGNDPNHDQTVPWGAGLAARRAVLEEFSALMAEDGALIQLGRRGNKLFSGEDIVFAWAAHRLGMGTGCFECLQVRHLIPATRVEPDYLRRIIAGHAYSTPIMRAFFGGRSSLRDKGTLPDLCKLFLKSPIADPRMTWSRWQARRAARETILKSWGCGPGDASESR